MVLETMRGVTVLLVAILALRSPEWAAGEKRQVEPVDAATAVSAKLPAGWSRVALIPWGSGPGKLAERLHSAEEQVVFRGPTRFLVFPDGGFAVLDVLGSKIEEFDPTGTPTRSLAYPAAAGNDDEALTIDLAAVAASEYWLLSLGRRAVLHVKGDGAKPASYPIEGLTSDSVLTGLVTDGRGNLYVLDSNDNTVFSMRTDGKPAARFRHDAARSLVVDPKGRFCTMDLSSPEDTRHWTLGRLTPPSTLETLGRIETRHEVDSLDLFGLDGKGNFYVYMGCGSIESPSSVEVVRYSADGKETGRVACPAEPIDLKFVHGKAVAPDGTLHAVVVRAEGLELVKHGALP